MSLFKGRDDVYAKRWQSKDGRSGYAPVCLNEWKSGLCRKPEVKCFDCPHKSYDVMDEKVIEAHLRGNIVAGVYPMCQDETCHFLAIDFDDEAGKKIFLHSERFVLPSIFLLQSSVLVPATELMPGFSLKTKFRPV